MGEVFSVALAAVVAAAVALAAAGLWLLIRLGPLLRAVARTRGWADEAQIVAKRAQALSRDVARVEERMAGVSGRAVVAANKMRTVR